MMPELTFFNRLSGVPNITTVRPSRPLGIGRQSGIPVEGLPDEDLTSGWANVQSNNYWSSTSNANNPNNAWIVNMWNGNMNNNNKSNNNYVWPVRSGEWLTPLFSFETLYTNYLKCRRNKRGTINALKFEIKAEENLFLLLEQLLIKSYQPSRSVCFIVERPKMREIIAADFRDRVVHHVLVKRLEDIYEPVFIHDSYSCRKGKGLHKAVERVREFIRKGSKNGRDRLYCDDFLILDVSPEKLEDIREHIRGFVSDSLSLSLNDKYNRVIPVSNGIDFLGYIINPDYMLVRRRVVNNLRERLNRVAKRLVSETAGMQIIRYDYKLLEQLRSVLASYRGHMKWADTYSLRRAILKRYSFLKEYFSFTDGKIIPLYKFCEIFPSVKGQYLYYMCLFRGFFILFQVGCFYEFYGVAPFLEETITLLNLKRVVQSKRGVIYGFPERLADQYLKILIERGVSVIIIKETDRYIGKVKERLPVMKIRKMEG